MSPSNRIALQAQIHQAAERTVLHLIRPADDLENRSPTASSLSDNPPCKEIERFVQTLLQLLPSHLSAARAQRALLTQQLQRLHTETDRIGNTVQALQQSQQTLQTRAAEARTHRESQGAALLKTLGWGCGGILVGLVDVPLAASAFLMKIEPGADTTLPTLTAWGAAIAITLAQILLLEFLILKPVPDAPEQRWGYGLRVGLGVLGLLIISSLLAALRRDAMGDGTASDLILLALTVIGYPVFGIISALMLRQARACHAQAQSFTPHVKRLREDCRTAKGKIRVHRQTARATNKGMSQKERLLKTIDAFEQKTVDKTCAEPLVVQLIETTLNECLANAQAFDKFIREEN